MPSPSIQALHLFAAAFAVSLVLGVARGVPVPAASAASGDAGLACGASEQGNAEPVRFVSAAEARELATQAEVAFIDCRPKQEYEAGHVAGSLHVDLVAHAAGLPPAVANAARSASTVITYCDATLDCERSLRVASLLSQSGASDVRVLEGGLPAWLSQGYPAQSGACTECETRP